MSENTTIPSLTLTPQEDEAAAAAAARETAVPEAPTLTLTPEATDAASAVQNSVPAQIDESMLSEAERKIVDEFSKKIDLTDSTQILQYGTAAQKNIASFSENALNKVRTKDLGEVGDTLSSLVVELKNNAPGAEKKRGFFQRSKVKIDEMKAQYDKAEANVDKICRILEQHQVALMKDVAMFDQMFELNQQYYKELTMYIIAGKKKLEACRNGELAELRKKAEETGTQEDAQAYNDYANLVERFEKKISDLELTRMISIQMGPQTRLLQNNDTLMIEKIQTSLVNTIPLWKSQMVLALGLERSRQATAAQSAVTNMTNELLKKNAEMLKMGTIATAKEAERGIVDVETLRKTNEDLISTLDEVMQIQKEGRQKRAEAEVELSKIEGELRQKLLELKH
ncbi:MAG: toxic anion resistance protein [Candidatus Onthomonas sp.]|nr:toxic anion resistance protein [Candidatus Onthomonas sp.]